MKMCKLAILASLSLMSLSAFAGTIKFHTGDPTRPTAGIDGWSVSYIGAEAVSINGTHSESASSSGSAWVVSTQGSFLHDRAGFWHNMNPLPGYGVEHASGTIAGNVYWWFEYVPDNPSDVPDTSGPYYADMQVRAKGRIDQIAWSYSSPVMGGNVYVESGMVGLQALVNGVTQCGPGDYQENTFSTGNPWNFQTIPGGFSFTWDPVLGKWLGKPWFGGAAGQLFDSQITLGDDSIGQAVHSFDRDFKVLKVRTPGGQTTTFNTPWS